MDFLFEHDHQMFADGEGKGATSMKQNGFKTQWEFAIRLFILI